MPSTATWSGLLADRVIRCRKAPLRDQLVADRAHGLRRSAQSCLDVTVNPLQDGHGQVRQLLQEAERRHAPRASGATGTAQPRSTDGGDSAPELGLLSSLKLVDAGGTTSTRRRMRELNIWLLNGNAVNMAYMLSVHLAAMTLNIEAGFVNEDAFYIPCGGTIERADGRRQRLRFWPTRTRQLAIRTARCRKSSRTGWTSSTTAHWSFRRLRAARRSPIRRTEL